MRTREGFSLAPFAAAAWAGAGVIALTMGFRAISDDDFARVEIAQRFAAAPTIDPSGTSWLPFPFWTLGLVMRVLGSGFGVARGFALVSAACTGWLLFQAARAFDLDERRALVAAILPLSLPLSACLAAAPVPELTTAALAVFALASMRGADPRRLFAASLAIFAATLSRYEAWPIAIVVAGLAASTKAARAPRFTAAAIALLGPTIWMLWNAHRHGDFLHFLARVAAYRDGLGETPRDALVGYPLALLREGGPLLFLAGFAAVRGTPTERKSLTRIVVALAALLAFLIAGDVRGGAPTHHPERALYIVFLLLAIVAASVRTLPRRGPAAALLGLTMAFALRLDPTRDALGASRSVELALGAHLRDVVPPGEPVLLGADSYGFLAVSVGLDRPGALVVRVPRAVDPRSHDDDPFASEAALASALDDAKAPWFIASPAQRLVAESVGSVVFVDGPYALLRRR